MFINDIFKSLVGKCVSYTLTTLSSLLHQKRLLAELNVCHEHIKRNQLVSKPRKYQFMAQELVFLGHVISKNSMKPDPNKIKAVSNIPLPQDQG